jgi:hypothetical protein
LPVYLQQFASYRRPLPDEELWSHAQLRRIDQRGAVTVEGDIELLDGAGHIVTVARGLRVQQIGMAHGRDKELHRSLIVPRWKPIPSDANLGSNSPSNWLIVADRSGVAEQVANRLEFHGHRCSLFRPTVDFGRHSTRRPNWDRARADRGRCRDRTDHRYPFRTGRETFRRAELDGCIAHDIGVGCCARSSLRRLDQDRPAAGHGNGWRWRFDLMIRQSWWQTPAGDGEALLHEATGLRIKMTSRQPTAEELEILVAEIDYISRGRCWRFGNLSDLAGG